MIIVWKWEDLSDQFPPAYQVNKVKGRPENQVVRLNLENNDQTLTFLTSCVKEYLQNGPLMVFLHKDHGYTMTAIEFLKSQFSAISIDRLKFVLFGGGGDFIYYSASELGLLDDFGWFMDEPEYEFKNPNSPTKFGEARIGSYNATGIWEIEAKYFEQVWSYYYGAFPQKTFQLKRDFINLLYPIWLSHQNMKNPDYSSEISLSIDERLLNRLASFCGLTTNEQDYILMKEERQTGRSLRFFMPADLQAFAGNISPLNTQYQDICQLLGSFVCDYQNLQTIDQTWLDNLPQLNELWTTFADELYKTVQPY